MQRKVFHLHCHSILFIPDGGINTNASLCVEGVERGAVSGLQMDVVDDKDDKALCWLNEWSHCDTELTSER